MANVLRTPTFKPQPSPRASVNSLKPTSVAVVSFRQSTSFRKTSSPLTSLRLHKLHSFRFAKFVPFAFDGNTEAPQVQEPEVQDLPDDAVDKEDIIDEDVFSDADGTSASPFQVLLQSYKEAFANNDEAKVAELESSLKSIEDEKFDLEGKIASLSEELSTEKNRILRISADFDNFRKRTERDRLSLVTNAQGEVVESLLGVLDNFERAKTQIKVETEGEEKINNSYQSIYKQFSEILTSLGVKPVETVGRSFDPLAHKPVGSKFNRVLDELFQTISQVCSGFLKTWIRF
ncbi:putative GrpE nucleotide exchange factor [Lupinus albus]|uniref:Putative GrpE nucleotide exchange factor n=1 Tax=Lupinus albus TaxID=3870 RepID=A0A6A4NME4_LUPAL|nr:putative GrpE nucleotide exchange factor [Lupinus albus]